MAAQGSLAIKKIKMWKTLLKEGREFSCWQKYFEYFSDIKTEEIC